MNRILLPVILTNQLHIGRGLTSTKWQPRSPNFLINKLNVLFASRDLTGISFVLDIGLHTQTALSMPQIYREVYPTCKTSGAIH